jgi:Heterokaryon incompatibility protein (HET)
MRLLCSKSLVLKEFSDKRLPPYAILSHTWGEGEMSLQDLEDGREPEKPGYQKVLRCCEEAARDGFSYTWVDTCCIDKTSSSELSEAINSMYRWYQQAGVCYVYLADVSKIPAFQASDAEIESALSTCRWFTRGCE